MINWYSCVCVGRGKYACMDLRSMSGLSCWVRRQWICCETARAEGVIQQSCKTRGNLFRKYICVYSFGFDTLGFVALEVGLACRPY